MGVGIELGGLTSIGNGGEIGLAGTRFKLPPMHRVEGEITMLKEGEVL
jgi:hypothetical protein